MTSEFDQQVTIPSTLKKYYTPKMIQVGTFLGGPVTAGYFIAENYKAFGQQSKVSTSWGYSILTAIVLLVVVIFLPSGENHNNGPYRYLIPLLYSWAAFSLVKYLQTNLINEHVAAGGITYGWGRVILIGLIGCILTFAVLFAIIFILFTLFPSL